MPDTLFTKWARLGEWPLYDILKVIVDYNITFETTEELYARLNEMDDIDFFYSDTHMEREGAFENVLYKLKRTIDNDDTFLDSIRSDRVKGGADPYDHDVPNIYVKPVNFLVWLASKSDLRIPDELKMLLPDVNVVADSIKINDDEFESKFPEFKTLDIKNPDKKSLQELKQKYGILRDEAYKWKLAIPVAVKVGWLYFEKGLDKRASEKAFLNMYRQEFGDVLKNDVLAKQMYHHIPPRGTKGSGEPQHPDRDINDIIKAAVLAGSMVDARDSMNLKSLRKSLSDESYAMPPDDILQKIIDATMKLDREDDE